ncbi:MAG: ABC transporter substrate-binding protein [Chloroflexi bacterium]|nr:ABC transporter substrate-binding protein [Chloroflexota bacterium]
MMKSTLLVIIVLLTSLLPAAALDANLTDGCVEDYAADVDYFPQKIEVVDAAKFTVEYFNNYKLVSVADAFDGATDFSYALVQCGTPAPSPADFPEGTQFIEVPTGALITLSTTQLPALSQLGLLDRLAGVDSGFYISTPEVAQRIAEGEIAEVGFGNQVNIELVLELEPQLVMSYGYNPASDAHPVLLEAGIFTALDASWRELSPLGRAEWIKFTALFYNEEERANAIYEDIVAQYEMVRERAAAAGAEERPAVLINSFLGYADAWYIPGEDTYVGQLIRDAGGDLLLAEAGSASSQGLGFEAVFEGGLNADVWLVETFGVNSSADMLALDSRFGDFAAFQSGELWNNNRDENANGGNNYYEWGLTNPHLVLADLLAIFHPDLMPDHEFAFYQRLASE